jgi:hypothetical protein
VCRRMMKGREEGKLFSDAHVFIFKSKLKPGPLTRFWLLKRVAASKCIILLF